MSLRVLPGADVRIEPDLVRKIRSDEVLTLGDRRRHVLLELPHDVYVPLDRLLDELNSAGLIGVLSHPERNRGILKQPNVMRPLVERGCLMQVTAASLTGAFGTSIQRFSESLVEQGLVHFVSTDAHGTKVRPPMLKAAFERVTELAGRETAIDLCCRHPAAVAGGGTVPAGCRKSTKSAWTGWFRRTFISELATCTTDTVSATVAPYGRCKTLLKYLDLRINRSCVDWVMWAIYPTPFWRQEMKITKIRSRYGANASNVGAVRAPGYLCRGAGGGTRDFGRRAGDGGVLHGQVVSVQGTGVAGAPVFVRTQDRDVATATTAADGTFKVQGLKGGVYQVSTLQGHGVYRLWSAGTAPPAAQNGAVVYTQSSVVDSNVVHYTQDGCGCGDGALKMLLSNPVVIAGLVATAIALPVALNQWHHTPVSH